MSHIIDLPLVAPSLPASWTAPSTSTAHLSRRYFSRPVLPHLKQSTALRNRNLLPSGPAYLAHVKRTLYGLSFEDEDAAREAEEGRKNGGAGKGEEEDDLGVGDEEETEELLSLDPKEWKVIFFFSL
jgi:DnaJ family protein C protein 2